MRESWSKYFLSLAQQVATRSTCNRAHVGAVITRSHHILATGYNGAPSGWDHCTDDGCLVINGHCCRTVHAERNALNHAARNGIRTEGASCYVTTPPCLRCFLDLVSAGVRSVYYPFEAQPRDVAEHALIGSFAKKHDIYFASVVRSACKSS